MNKNIVTLYEYVLKRQTWTDTYHFSVREVKAEEKPKTYRTFGNGNFANYNKTLSKDGVDKVIKDNWLKFYVSLNPSKDTALQALLKAERQELTYKLDILEEEKDKLTKLLSTVDNNEYVEE